MDTTTQFALFETPAPEPNPQPVAEAPGIVAQMDARKKARHDERHGHAAYLRRMQEQADALTATYTPEEMATLRAKLAIQRARERDEEAARMAEAKARVDRLNAMVRAAAIVAAKGLRRPGTKRALEVTVHNYERILARHA